MKKADKAAVLETLTQDRKGGRLPAGSDPEKRRQIMEGADRVFSTLGFDAASMSDVAQEAGVSKATLYVYFDDKEHLFTALCAVKRDRNIAELIATLTLDRAVWETLATLGSEVVRRVSQPQVIATQRIVIGVADRMPDIGQEFFAAGAQRLTEALAELLAHHVAQGVLAIDDTQLAAAQFLELTQATITRPRLFGVVKGAAGEDEISRVVGSAVKLFLSAYTATPDFGSKGRK